MRITQTKKIPIQTIAARNFCHLDPTGQHSVRLVPMYQTVYIQGPYRSGLRAHCRFVRNLGLKVIQIVEGSDQDKRLVLAVRGPNAKTCLEETNAEILKTIEPEKFVPWRKQYPR